ncbi:DNA N-6-adenine-methyltransferase [Aquamicrobium soli]|uniref:DNA N-6-adenine-methyltransferase n=1 Tax=Aquamicrobium soli TaxID=1811518 RepID=A0ABV7KDL3_9HYPH
MTDLVPIDKINISGGTQSRATLDQDTINDYRDALQAGATFPPVTVFYDGSHYWLADGFHRVHAHIMRRVSNIEAEVRQGTCRDAVLYSVGANASHGLRRTNADKRRAVETLLEDEEWGKWSDREIARRCGVDNSFVSRLRKAVTVDEPQSERTYTTKHGTVATMQVANIGKAPPSGITDQWRAEAADSLAGGREQSDPVAANRNAPCSRPHRADYSGDNEWYTPARFVEMARSVLGQIDVDPASNDHAQKTVKAATYYTAETNGLDKEWNGTVWMNPPFGRGVIALFIDKLVQEYGSGRTTEAIALVNNNTDTGWFNSLFNHSTAVCFVKGRIPFYSPTRPGGPGLPQGQAFAYFGLKPVRFFEVFSAVGNVVNMMKPAHAAHVDEDLPLVKEWLSKAAA